MKATYLLAFLVLSFVMAIISQTNASVNWVPFKAGNPIPPNAVQGGVEKTPGVNNGALLFVCRGNHNGGVHPGKLIGGSCNIPYGGEVVLSDFEIAVGPGAWGAPKTGLVGALVGGTENGGPLYVCRADLDEDVVYVLGKQVSGVDHGLAPGKVVNGMCNIAYGGRELILKVYEVFYPQ